MNIPVKKILALDFKQEITSIIFYLVIMALLSLQFSFPSTPPYEEYNNCLQTNALYNLKRIEIGKKESLDLVYQCSRMDSSIVYNASNLIAHVDEQSKEVYAYIETIKTTQANSRLSRKAIDSLFNKLALLNTCLVNAVDTRAREGISYILPTYSLEKCAPLKWEIPKNGIKIFDNMPSSGIKTILSAIQNLVLLSDEIIIEQIGIERACCILRFDAIKAIAIPDKGWVFPGEKNHANIFLASYEMPTDPIFKCGNGSIFRIENNMAYWEKKTTNLGIETINGTVSTISDPLETTKHWSFQYLVLAKGICLQGDKMNTCYRGVPNPISISVPGYEPESLNLSVAGARVTNIKNGQYNIEISNIATDKLYADVAATNKQGKTSTVARLELRIKDLPLPTVTIAGYKHTIPYDTLLLHPYIDLLGEDNDFETPYKAGNYDVFFITHNRSRFSETYLIQDNSLFSNAEAAEKIRQLAKGDRIILIPHTILSGGKAIEVPPATIVIE